MGRGIVPNEKTFNQYKEKNAAYVSDLAVNGLIAERAAGGFEKTIAMMIEEDFLNYEDEQRLSLASESIGGYSVSYDNTEKAKRLELNAKSLEQKKNGWLRVYCHVTNGRR